MSVTFLKSDTGEALHSGKSDVDDVGELGLPSNRVRVAKSKEVVHLSEGVDGDRDVRTLQVVGVLFISS